MSNKLVIAGALYKSGDMILKPHFTGEYYMVDCTEYLTTDGLLEKYNDIQFAINHSENAFSIEYDGEIYYKDEYSPYYTDDFELISDLSDLKFIDTEYNT